MRDPARWLALGFVVAVSAFFNGVSMTGPEGLQPDAVSYIRPAYELARHHAFRGSNPLTYAFQQPGNDRIGPDTIRTPGYPLFLAAIIVAGLPLKTALVVQHLLAVVLSTTIFLFVDVVLRRRRAALVAGLLIATQPAIVTFAHEYMSDILAVAVITAAMACMLRFLRGGSIGWGVAAGVLTGCATLVRPVAIAWFVPLGVIAAMRVPWRAAAIFTAAALLLPAAWMARNYVETGVPTISSIAGENMLFFRGGSVLALEDKPLLFRLSALQQQFGFVRAVERLKPRLAAAAFSEMRAKGIEPRNAPHAVLAREYGRLGGRIVARHIPEAVELAVSGVVEMFVYTYTRFAGSWTTIGSPLLWLTNGCAAAMFVAACFGLVVMWRSDRTLALLVGATIIYFAVITLPEGDVRFAIPFAPAYAIAVGIGIDQLIARRARAATADADLRR
jgi:4-amino-4-deoxy-L-arabinose transferase-like glycosyltransferase